MERNFKYTNLSGAILFILRIKILSQYIISHKTTTVNVQNY